MGNYHLNFKTSEADFQILMNALKEEGTDENGRGFINNIDIIVELFEERKLISLHSEFKPVGFATWRTNNNTADIDFIWIEPDSRGKRLGKLFQELLNESLRSRGIYCLEISIASEDGMRLANAIGFKDLSDSDYRHYHCSNLANKKYLFLKDGRQSYLSPTNVGTELIIWPTEYRVANTEPSQCFALDDNLENNPILTIVNRRAKMEIRRDGETVVKSYVDCFFNEEKQVQRGYVLYLNHMPDKLK